jgi:alpha-glucosidase
MTQVLREYDDRFMITEAHPQAEDKIQGYLQYYEGVNPQLSAPFNLEGIYTPWTASDFRNFVNSFQASMKKGYTPIYTIGNHDESRIASRIGKAAARTAAMMLLTLPGLPIMYYGDEIGMIDVKIPKAQSRDPFVGVGNNRDAQRTPMQWDSSQSAGFTSGKPWLPIAKDYKEVNVQHQSQETASILQLYKQLIYFRNHSSALQNGVYFSVNLGEDIFAYKRSHAKSKLLIILNFSAAAKEVFFPSLNGVVKLSTYLDSGDQIVGEHMTLRKNEGLIIEIMSD